jgi:F-type H+-transporting ATPase subunit b
VHQDIVAKAREEAQGLAEQARQSIEREKNAAISQLRREMADLAVQAASALVDANLDDEKNRKLVDDLIAGIPETAQHN